MNSLALLLLLQQGTLDPDLAVLVSRMPPPERRTPSVFNLVSTSRLFTGDQLNVLTAAWLPRSLRLRLRQPPSLTPPVITGVWSTPRTPVTGAVASREGEDEAYDLFVVAQTVYPLSPGPLTIPPSRLTWVEPARGRAPPPQDRSRSVSSPPVRVEVSPLPSQGLPPGFTGPVGRDLRVEYRLTGSGRAGTVVPVEVAILGTGSVPLWPAPEIDWPGAARAYDQGADASYGPQGSRLGGARVFRYSVVPDSAGGLSLPPLEYPYFDPATGRYRVARAPGTVVPILESATAGASRAAVALLEPGRVSLAQRVAGLPGYVPVLLTGLPLALMGLIALARRFPRPRPEPAPGSPVDRLDRLVRALLPTGTGPHPMAIARAFREAGVPARAAERLARLHLGVESARYGPGSPIGSAHGADPLAAEIETELGRVPARIRRKAGIAAALALLAAGSAAAQDGMELYHRGHYLAAAEAFRAEALRDPSAARWYNVAAAEYLGGRDARAAAVLLAVRPIEPRNPRVRSLWNALAREHGELRRAGSVWPVSPGEGRVVAVLAGWIALVGYLARRRWVLLWAAPAALAVTALLYGAVRQSVTSRPRAVLTGGASQRVSPHGLAPALAAVPGFTVVELIRPEGGWWLVRAGVQEGWIPSGILIPVESF